MDQILEWLAPAIIFIVWAISSVLQKANESRRDKENDDQPYTPLDDPANDDDDRTRRIQEEIRRKIAQRRGQGSGPVDQPETRYDPHKPEWQQQREASPPMAAPQQRESFPSRDESFPPPVTTSTEPPTYFEVPAPSRNYEAELAEKRREMEAAQRRMEEARARVRRQLQEANQEQHPGHPQRSVPAYLSGSLRSQILAGLRDPRAARKAVLNYEILGTPVGMRRNGQLYPHWEV